MPKLSRRKSVRKNLSKRGKQALKRVKKELRKASKKIKGGRRNNRKRISGKKKRNSKKRKNMKGGQALVVGKSDYPFKQTSLLGPDVDIDFPSTQRVGQSFEELRQARANLLEDLQTPKPTTRPEIPETPETPLRPEPPEIPETPLRPEPPDVFEEPPEIPEIPPDVFEEPPDVFEEPPLRPEPPVEQDYTGIAYFPGTTEPIADMFQHTHKL